MQFLSHAVIWNSFMLLPEMSRTGSIRLHALTRWNQRAICIELASSKIAFSNVSGDALRLVMMVVYATVVANKARHEAYFLAIPTSKTLANSSRRSVAATFRSYPHRVRTLVRTKFMHENNLYKSPPENPRGAARNQLFVVPIDCWFLSVLICTTNS